MQWLLCIDILTRNDKVAPNLVQCVRGEKGRREVSRYKKRKESIGVEKLDLSFRKV